MASRSKELLQKHDQKLRFASVGILNTALDFGLLFLGVWLGLPKIGANYISTGIAFLFSFFMNRSFTFKSKGSAKKQIAPFLVVTMIGLWVLQPIVILAITSWLSVVNETITLFAAKILASVVTLVWNFVMYKRFVFNK